MENWIKDWYKKQEQNDRLVNTYKNHEMTIPPKEAKVSLKS